MHIKNKTVFKFNIILAKFCINKMLLYTVLKLGLLVNFCIKIIIKIANYLI